MAQRKNPPSPRRRVTPPRELPRWGTSPHRHLKLVDPVTRAYRVTSLHSYLAADARRPDPDPNDPRLPPADEVEQAERARVRAATIQLRRRWAAALAAGEPLLVPAWRLTGGPTAGEVSHVDWLADGSVDWLSVSSDDVVTPTRCPDWAASSWDGLSLLSPRHPD